jgi:pimeloyl-ACP methyl ester carboxylesterase
VASTELSTGMIDYDDTGGDGPMVVPVRGLTQSGTVWREVVADLRADHRIVVPTLPLGRTDNRCATMPTSPRGLAPLIAEFLERLDLHDVTLVANDRGGPQVTAVERPERIGGWCSPPPRHPTLGRGSTRGGVARLRRRCWRVSWSWPR